MSKNSHTSNSAPWFSSSSRSSWMDLRDAGVAAALPQRLELVQEQLLPGVRVVTELESQQELLSKQRRPPGHHHHG